MRTNILFCVIASLALSMTACNEEQVFQPKPKGFNKIDLPAHSYVQLDSTHPYSFEYSSLAKILPDTSGLAEPHWMDIYYPQFKANIQITYKPVKNPKQLAEYINDSHTLANKHNIKAYAIDELNMDSENGYPVTIFELSGEVPSQVQFHASDSTGHFLRGAVYFRTSTKNDSLAPIIKYMKEDVFHLIQTLTFNKK